MLHDIHLPFTTDGAGAATVAAGFWPGPCRLIAAVYDRGNVDAGADLTLTWDRYNVAENILTVTNAGAADAIWYPRRLVQDLAGADLTGTAGGDREPPLILGRPSLTVAQGTATKSGELILVVEVL